MIPFQISHGWALRSYLSSGSKTWDCLLHNLEKLLKRQISGSHQGSRTQKGMDLQSSSGVSDSVALSTHFGKVRPHLLVLE